MLPNLHRKVDTKITITDPNEFVQLLEKKASSNPLRRKLKLFIESVAVMAAGGWRTSDVRMQNTLAPGVAKVGGKDEFVRGYLWECAAIQPKASEHPTIGLCFLTLNERGLFDRLYGNNPEAEAELLYTEFLADPEPEDKK